MLCSGRGQKCFISDEGPLCLCPRCDFVTRRPICGQVGGVVATFDSFCALKAQACLQNEDYYFLDNVACEGLQRGCPSPLACLVRLFVCLVFWFCFPENLLKCSFQKYQGWSCTVSFVASLVVKVCGIASNVFKREFPRLVLGSSPSPLTFTLHQFLNRWSRWGTTDDFTTSFLHFSLFSSVLWDLANSRPVHSLMLSSYLFFCLPRLLNHFTVACKMVWARPDDWDMSIQLQFASPYDAKVFVWSDCLLDLGTDFLTGNVVFCMRCVVSCRSTLFPCLLFFFAAFL